MQGQITDLVATNFKKNSNQKSLRIFIETHSEHMLTRLKKRVKEKQIKHNDISIIFIDSNEKGSQIRSIEIDEDGSLIGRWPTFFFDEE